MNQELPAAATVDLTATEDDIVVTAEEPQAPLPPCHVMWDIETWGTGNDAVPISIGACKFTADEIGEQFHVGIDPASAQALGLRIDAGTVLWWMDPERDEARRDWLQLEKIDLPSALAGLDHWIRSGSGVLSVWGNGSTFDNVILRSAFKAAGLEYPVGFWQDACYRTVKNQSTVKIECSGTHHNALDDAISQAKHLQAIWREDAGRLALLQISAKQFRYYEQLHRAKDTPEADEKAEVNRALAEKIEEALPRLPDKALV